MKIIFVKLKVICDIFNNETYYENYKIMRVLILKLYMTLFLLTIYISVFSQENIKKANSNDNAIDSLKRMEGVAPNTQKTSEIVFSTSQALKFLQQIFNPELLKNKGDSLKD